MSEGYCESKLLTVYHVALAVARRHRSSARCSGGFMDSEWCGSVLPQQLFIDARCRLRCTLRLHVNACFQRSPCQRTANGLSLWLILLVCSK